MRRRKRYEVRHLFSYAGVLYGPWNAGDVAHLPHRVRQLHTRLGHITEIPAATVAAAQPALNQE